MSRLFPGLWHDLERAATKSSWSLYLAEFIGTALLMIGGLSAVIVITSPTSPVASLGLPHWLLRFVAGAFFGLSGALVTISPFGKHSGAHINPAMTFAFWLTRRISTSHAVGYVAAQCLGATAGAAVLLVWGRMGRPIKFGATVPEPGLPMWAAVAGEVLTTVVLIVVVFLFLATPRLKAFTPWTIPLMYSVMVCLEGPLTGTSTNPARSLGPAIVTGIWTDMWVYFVGPLLGSCVGVLIYQVWRRGRDVGQARLVHHPADGLATDQRDSRSSRNCLRSTPPA